MINQEDPRLPPNLGKIWKKNFLKMSSLGQVKVLMTNFVSDFANTTDSGFNEVSHCLN